MKSLHVLCVLLISATTLWAESPTAKDLEAIEIDGIHLGMPFKEVLKMPEGKACKFSHEKLGCKYYSIRCKKDSPEIRKKLGAKAITRDFLSQTLGIAVAQIDGEDRVVGILSAVLVEPLHYVDSGSRYSRIFDLISKKAGEPIEASEADLEIAKNEWDTRGTGITINSVQREVWSPQHHDPGHPEFQARKFLYSTQHFVIQYEKYPVFTVNNARIYDSRR